VPQIQISAPSSGWAPAPAPDSFIRYFETTFFDLSNMINIVPVTIHKNFFSNNDFLNKFLRVSGK
jgi:hypothetical protein